MRGASPPAGAVTGKYEGVAGATLAAGSGGASNLSLGATDALSGRGESEALFTWAAAVGVPVDFEDDDGAVSLGGGAEGSGCEGVVFAGVASFVHGRWTLRE